MKNKMKVEVWSDIMCPFCYIGKRRFETALKSFEDNDQIELVWKSYQLAPDLKTQPNKSIHEFLAEHKGTSIDEATGMNNQISQMAAQVGLTFDYDNMVVANSFNAHQFAHFAKQFDKQNEAEELLFQAHFTDGKNIDDIAVLVALGAALDLDTAALKKALENNSYSDNVKEDIVEAQQIGVRGVPFFVFNRKYAASGAQSEDVFLQTIEKSFQEWKEAQVENPIEVIDGQSCTPDGNCE